MKVGDLVRITYRDVIYMGLCGGPPTEWVDVDETSLVIDDNENDYIVRVLHPTYGPGFITRVFLEVISESR